jgi:hypothetical protein
VLSVVCEPAVCTTTLSTYTFQLEIGLFELAVAATATRVLTVAPATGVVSVTEVPKAKLLASRRETIKKTLFIHYSRRS